MRIIFINLFLFISALSIAQQDSCEIKIQISGINGGIARLIGIYVDQNFLADSAIVDNLGNFTFRRKSPYKSGLFYVILPDQKTNFQFILDKDQKFSIHGDKADLVNSLKFNKSIENDLLYQSLILQSQHERVADSLYKVMQGKLPTDQNYLSAKNALKHLGDDRKKQIESFAKNYPNSFFVKYKIAGQNPDIVDVRKPNGDLDTLGQLEAYRNQFWDNVDLKDERLLYTPVISNKLRKYITELTPQNPDSIIRQADIVIQKSMVNDEMFKFFSNWIALNYQPTKTNVMDGEAVYVHIIDKYFTKDRAKWLNEKELADIRKKAWEMQASLLNKIGPDVISTDPSGNTKSIYEIKAPFVIVYMYNPNCEHCQKETPKLKKFYEEWKSKGVEVFAIVLDSNEKEWKDYIEKNQMQDWINVFDPTNKSIYAKYYVDITPEIYVLNKDRKIVGKNLKVEQLPIILEREMKKM